MPNIKTVSKYLAMVALLVFVTVGGFASFLPMIFNLPTDFMWMIFPIALVLLLVVIYVIVTMLLKMIRKDFPSNETV